MLLLKTKRPSTLTGRNVRLSNPELDVGRVHPWVGLGRVGSQNFPSSVGRVQCQKYIINAINMQEIRPL